jgi:serine protease inhibitor
MRILSCLLILSLFSACTRKEESAPEEDVAPGSFSKKSNIKGSDLPAPVSVKPGEAPFQILKLHSGQPRNTSISPLSLKMAFELLYPAAGEDSRLALEKGFGFSMKNPNRFSAERALAARLKSEKDKTARLAIGNSIWVKNPDKLNPGFRTSLENLSAEVKPLNLKEMNQWVKTLTEGKIPLLLDSLDPKIPLLAVNALYFKGDWVSPFKKSETLTGNFRSSETSVLVTDLMRQVHSFKYFENETSKWLELPYKDSPFSMVLALPKKDFDLKTVVAALDSTSVDDILTKMKEERVELVLPKFKISEKSSLKEDLSLAGYVKLFSPGEWKAISSDSEFVLGDVIQAITIEVDEQGTIAAAATALTMETTSFDLKSKKPFYCDQPFLYLLVNRESDEIYFMGRVFKPE